MALLGDRAGDDVALGELVDEALAMVVAQHRTLAAQGLRQEEAAAGHRGRVELHELEVGDGGACAVGHDDALAGGAERVRRGLPERGIAARCEQRRPPTDASLVRQHPDAAPVLDPGGEHVDALADRDTRMLTRTL